MATILLAEDNGPLLRLYSSALKSEHVILPAETASEAIRQINKHHPDLMILDLNMPDAPGTAILEYVTSHPQFADLQVVVITGFAHYQRDALPDVVVDVLHKPVTTSTLLRVIDQVVTARQSR